MSPRNVTVDIGINGAFLTRRWEDPDNFIRLTKELEYPYHEFCADVLDPFFSGNKDYQLRTARKVKAAAEKYGVTITDICTGMATHRSHGLSHSEPSVCQRMKEWIVGIMDIATAMGVDRIGGHWDAIPAEIIQNRERYQASLAKIYSEFRDLAALAKEKGLKALFNEQMYIPSEVPWTIAGAEEFLIAVNKDSNGVPVSLIVDVGHQSCKNYGARGSDTSYLEWVRRYAAVSEIIHLQQTPDGESSHWPFTERYNRQGHIHIEKLIGAIVDSHRRFSRDVLSNYLEAVRRNILVLEVIPTSTKSEDILLKELGESREYLRRWVPTGGMIFRVA